MTRLDATPARREDQPVRHGGPRRAAHAAATPRGQSRRRSRGAGLTVTSVDTGRAVARGRLPRRGRSRQRQGTRGVRALLGGGREGAAADSRATGGGCSSCCSSRLLPVPVRLRAQLRHPARDAGGRGSRSARPRAARSSRPSCDPTYFDGRRRPQRRATIDAAARPRARARGAGDSGGLLASACAQRRDGRGAGHHRRRQRQHGDDRRSATSTRVLAEASRRPAGGRGGRVRRSIGVEPRVWYNPELRSTLFLVPGLIAFIAMITAVVSTALSIVREKEQRHDGAGPDGADLARRRSSSARRCRIWCCRRSARRSSSWPRWCSSTCRCAATGSRCPSSSRCSWSARSAPALLVSTIAERSRSRFRRRC